MASGFTYDKRCCSDGDCAAIPDSAVRIVSDGFEVTLGPEDHPLVTERFTQHIGYGDKMFPAADLGKDPTATSIQLSPDDRWHACIFPKNTIRCLYILPGGV